MYWPSLSSWPRRFIATALNPLDLMNSGKSCELLPGKPLIETTVGRGPLAGATCIVARSVAPPLETSMGVVNPVSERAVVCAAPIAGKTGRRRIAAVK